MDVGTVKTRLREALANRGLTLTDVAYACGVSRSAVAQWFTDKPSWRPIPERHMATIRELLAEPSAPVKAAGPEPQLVILQPLAGAASPLPEPARKPRRAPRAPAPGPMHWGAPPFLGQMPAPGPPMHYPGHWASPPVMPPPAPAYVGLSGWPPEWLAEGQSAGQQTRAQEIKAAGPQHTVVVAAHNHASQLGEPRDVRSPERGAEFLLEQFFGLTGPIRREDREAFEARLTLEASERGFTGSPELRQMIEALRAAVRSHNRKFGY